MKLSALVFNQLFLNSIIFHSIHREERRDAHSQQKHSDE